MKFSPENSPLVSGEKVRQVEYILKDGFAVRLYIINGKAQSIELYTTRDREVIELDDVTITQAKKLCSRAKILLKYRKSTLGIETQLRLEFPQLLK